jgi:hypothetical protein
VEGKCVEGTPVDRAILINEHSLKRSEPVKAIGVTRQFGPMAWALPACLARSGFARFQLRSVGLSCGFLPAL